MILEASLHGKPHTPSESELVLATGTLASISKIISLAGLQALNRLNQGRKEE
jgi:hypothetical protein